MKNTSKILKSLGQIVVFAIAVSTVHSCINNASSSTKPVIKAMTEEKQTEIAAEQLAFIKCKQQEGRLMKENEDHALKIIKSWGLKPGIMKSPEVHARADQMIREYGVCDLWENVRSATDIQIKSPEQAKEQIKGMSEGQLQYIDTLAHAACMQKQGNWDLVKRDNELEEKLMILLEKNMITEQDLVELPKHKSGLMAWNMDKRLTSKNCAQSKEWRKLTKGVGKDTSITPPSEG